MHIAALWRGAVLAAAFATVTAPAGCGALISSSTRSSFVGATMGPSCAAPRRRPEVAAAEVVREARSSAGEKR